LNGFLTVRWASMAGLCHKARHNSHGALREALVHCVGTQVLSRIMRDHQIIYDYQPHAGCKTAAITLLVRKKGSESGLSLEFVEEVLVLAKVVPKMPGGVQFEKFLSHPVARICP